MDESQVPDEIKTDDTSAAEHKRVERTLLSPLARSLLAEFIWEYPGEPPWIPK